MISQSGTRVSPVGNHTHHLVVAAVVVVGLAMALLSFTAIGVIFAAALLLLTFILSSDLRGYGAGNVFAYHAAFMVVAFVFLMPLGILSYKLNCGSRGNSVYPTRDSRRVLHGTLGLLAALFVLLGYMIAFVYHQSRGLPHMPFSEPQSNSPTARSAHVVIGLIAIACTVLQMVMGLYKYVQLTKIDAKVFTTVHCAWRVYLGEGGWVARCFTTLNTHACARAYPSSPPQRTWAPFRGLWACYASPSPRTLNTRKRTRCRRSPRGPWARRWPFGWPSSHSPWRCPFSIASAAPPTS